MRCADRAPRLPARLVLLLFLLALLIGLCSLFRLYLAFLQLRGGVRHIAELVARRAHEVGGLRTRRNLRQVGLDVLVRDSPPRLTGCGPAEVLVPEL
mgnify:CR=1 FL=1